MGRARRQVGTVIRETYRLERLVGEGGMGAVYEASHSRLSRRFAIKLLLPEVADDPTAIARFRREAEITSALGHPHILDVTDFNYTAEGAPFIVMEFLEGENLARRIYREGGMALLGAASIFRQTASALQAAHQEGIIHRDLKPQNIFLCKRGERSDFVKVLDFGISKVIGTHSADTKTGGLLGTAYYMSPEQAQGVELDPRTDVFSMGTILFEMLAGRKPFTGDSIPAVLFKIAYHDPRPLRSFRPDLPEVIERVIGRALHKQREERAGSMKEFWQELAAVITRCGETVDDAVDFTEDRQVDWGRPSYVDLPATEPHAGELLEPITCDAPAPVQLVPVDTIRDPRTPLQAGDAVPVTGPGVPDDSRGVTQPVRGRRWRWVAIAAVLVAAVVAAVLIWDRSGPRGPVLQGPPLRIAPPGNPHAAAEHGWTPLVSYLERRLGRPVRLVRTHTYGQMMDALLAGEVDVVHFSVFPYLMLRRRDPNVRPLAMTVTEHGRTYRSYLVVLRKSAMRRIADLRNKRVCYVDRKSTSGYMMPRVMVLRAGFDPNTFFSSEQFSVGNYGSLQDLLGERCDVATVASDAFAYASQRGIATEKLRVVEKSPPLPQGIYCASSRLPHKVVVRLREALLALDVQREFGRKWLNKDFRLIGYAPVALRDLEAFARDLDRIRRR